MYSGNRPYVNTAMITLNSNLYADKTRNNQTKVESALSQAMERLSSGMRINGARDDAAGQAIANRMTANLRADSAVARGIDDGISLSQTAEGGLANISNLLIRAKELAVQAATGTLSLEDRASIQKEFESISATINHISNNTEIFGKYPLATDDPELPPLVYGDVPPLSVKFPTPGTDYNFTSGIVPLAYVPAGATNVVITINSLGLDDDIQLFTRDGKHIVGTPFNDANPDYTWVSKGITDDASANAKFINESNGFLPGASYDDSSLTQGGPIWVFNGGATATLNGLTIRYSGDTDRYEDASNGGFNDGQNGAQMQERLRLLGTVPEDLIVMVVGNGSFSSNVTWSSLPAPTMVPAKPPRASEPIEIVTSANFGDEISKKTIAPTPADTKTLGISKTKLDPAEEASKALGALDKALEKVSGYRSEYGSHINTFESAKATLAQSTLATTAARSRIEDADYAMEVSKMSRAQIISQASTAVLVQANQMPEVALALLKG